MADLTTKYLGLTLKNPVIAGSCDLTSSVELIKKLESAGVGAVVLKSIFEEDIHNELQYNAENNDMLYAEKSETMDFADMHLRFEKLADYSNLIQKAKNEVLIPVIASINCVSDHEWPEFAKTIQKAGADALEINISLSPFSSSDTDFEKLHLNIIKKVLGAVSIPVSVKISSYSTRLGRTILDISKSGVAGIVLFNKYYQFDIDINKEEINPATKYSSASDGLVPLKWISMLSGKLTCSIAASTGVYDGASAIKQLLAGADAVQMVSAIYQKGFGSITTTISEIDAWMDKKGYNSIGQFKGKLNLKDGVNPALYERMQFLKYFQGR